MSNANPMPPAYPDSGAIEWMENAGALVCRFCKYGMPAPMGFDDIDDWMVRALKRFEHGPDCLVPLMQACEEAVAGGA